MSLVATGSSPYHAPDLPFDNPRVYDWDTVLDLSEIPPFLAGSAVRVIGCDYACLVAGLGVKVALVEGKTWLVQL